MKREVLTKTKTNPYFSETARRVVAENRQDADTFRGRVIANMEAALAAFRKDDLEGGRSANVEAGRWLVKWDHARKDAQPREKRRK